MILDHFDHLDLDEADRASWTPIPYGRHDGPAGAASAEGGYMPASDTIERDTSGRSDFDSAVVEHLAMVAAMRSEADGLVRCDGGVEARKRAKSIRISAAWSERYVTNLTAMVHRGSV